jgi:DNA-binding HxlR family transcriptional regulator
MNKKAVQQHMPAECSAHLKSVQDTLDILTGKWKITIIAALRFGKKRFMELQREIDGIGAKMLSKELNELELNELITRTVYDTRPVTVEYELTEYGKTLQPIIQEMYLWGAQHRKRIMKKKTT